MFPVRDGKTICIRGIQVGCIPVGRQHECGQVKRGGGVATVFIPEAYLFAVGREAKTFTITPVIRNLRALKKDAPAVFIQNAKGGVSRTIGHAARGQRHEVHDGIKRTGQLPALAPALFFPRKNEGLAVFVICSSRIQATVGGKGDAPEISVIHTGGVRGIKVGEV